MNTLYPIIEPIVNAWNHYTSDQILDGITTYKKEWHNKFLQSERLHINEEYKAAHKRFYEEPQLATLFEDNWTRFSILAFAERLVTVRQAHDVLRARYQFANSTSGGLEAVRSQGLLFGSLRGNLLNALHFTLVYYHPLVLSKGSVANFIAYSTAFEALCYPLDTIKTLVYADVNRSYKSIWHLLKHNFEKRGFDMLYRGLPLKLFYNLAFGLNLASISNDSNLVYLTTPIWLASYGLLTLKTRLQVADTTLSSHNGQDPAEVLKKSLNRGGMRGLYAGLIPFAILNLFFAWNFSHVFSAEKKKSILGEIASRETTSKRETSWANL